MTTFCKLICFSLVFGAFMAGAQAYAQVSEAKAELRNLLNGFTNLQATFAQVVTDLQGQELQVSEGVIALQKPQQLRWEVTLPEESLLIADGLTIYNIDPFVEQITLLDQSQLTNSNPLMLLVSDDESQWQSISVEKSEQAYVVFPNSQDASITKLTLYFNQAGVLVKLVSVDQQQQTNQVSFSNTIYNADIDDNLFIFLPPQEWVVDDQRSTNASQ